MCVGVSKPLLRCWKFDTRPTQQFVLILFDFFRFLSSARDAEMCLWREHWVYFKKVVHGTRTTSDYIPRVDQSTRVKFNPSFFPLSLPQDSPSVFSILTQERKNLSRNFSKGKKKKKKHFGEEESVAMGFLLLGDTHKREGGGVSNNS